ncbi:MAG TPA: SDR family NAD(P)-dependent oxidoreductase [Burkholderiales bacterium]|nr:SDR family NAD(P)-dependent oxidoreductase [Burkholderiales bacterium]
MDLGLRDKKVLITGGSKGIGLACARVFIAEGARVAVVSRSPENLVRAKKTLREAYTIAADLTDAAAAAAMVESVEKEFGALDVLVNSAGAARRTDAADLSPEAWRAAMDAKYFTYINVIDPVIKLMAARGRGVIVNVIGSGGKVASPTHLAGGAANAALMLATAGLANAFAKRGVRVVGLNPGITNTERVAEGLKAEAKRSGITEDEALKRAIQRLPLGKLAEPAEIADIVAFAASERGRYLTGANISVDGAASAAVV